MTRQDKLVARLKSRPRDFRWDEPVRLIRSLGYEEINTETGGSRRRFAHSTAPALSLHEPHPSEIVKTYVVDEVLRVLTEGGLL